MLHCDCSKPNIWIGYSHALDERFLRCLNCQWQSRSLSTDELDDLVAETLVQREQLKSGVRFPPPVAEMDIWQNGSMTIGHHRPEDVKVGKPVHGCSNCGCQIESGSNHCNLCREMYAAPRRSGYWVQLQEKWEAEQQHKRRIVRGDA